MKKFIFGLILFLSIIAYRTDYAGASVDNFVISNFSVDYYLDKDNDGRSTLKTVELITADFPSYDQNHGIERYLPMSYDKHRTGLAIKSVTDANGGNIKYSTSRSGDNLVVRIGDADKYVHGKTEYVITYTQNDVTRYFSDVDYDEFYWDVNGTGWSQPFSNVEARIHIAPNIADKMSDNMACYYGPKGLTARCEINKKDNVVTVKASNLKANENVTFAIGFNTGTFTSYEPGLFDFISDNLVVIELTFISLLFAIVVILRIFKDKSAPGRPTIIAEYLPPKGIDVPMASFHFNHKNSWVAATLVDLAIRKNIKMISKEKKNIFSGRKYIIEFVSDDRVSKAELDLINAFFGLSPDVGQQYEIKSNNRGAAGMALAKKISDIRVDINTKANFEGYFITHPGLHRNMYLIGLFMAVQAVAIGYIFQKSNEDFVLVCAMAGVGLLLTFFVTASSKPGSAKSSEIRDHLKGLKLYIKTAEEDRIKYLQSPTGTIRDAVDTSDGLAVLRIYERLLPYAIIMGVEKDWVGVLGEYYSKYNSSPDWYSGHDSFSSAAFINEISSFSSTTRSSTIFASSLSGGSSGGGSSGGGGGGGGGGGW